MWCCGLRMQLTTGVTTINVLRQSTTYKGSVVVRALGGSGLSAHMHFKDGTLVSAAKAGAKPAKLSASTLIHHPSFSHACMHPHQAAAHEDFSGLFRDVLLRHVQ